MTKEETGDDAGLRRWLEAAGAQLSDAALTRTMLSLSPGERMTLGEHWPLWTNPGQEEPPGDWRVWLMMAGRGFGKTRAGAEWVSARARETSGARIALVGASVEEVVKVMVKGQSGLIAVARTGEEPAWLASKGELRWPNGAIGFAYSGARPDKLRGPEHHFAWCDELAKWRQAQASWDTLMMGLRLGEAPRTMVTTTPRPITALKTIIGLERTVTTGGRTADNPHLPEDYQLGMARMYGGSRLGRQELDGHLFEDAAGALWTRALIEASRQSGSPARGGAEARGRRRRSAGERGRGCVRDRRVRAGARRIGLCARRP
ncbi:terminase large subunit domain-containing protein [Enterovirga sp. GCM10030262]|uniref:terminase large subunit domain-containing protein n=1 Tax=Enterovirga sp. GCM10030262 TaxID=3273391 RepID=UPI0036114936